MIARDFELANNSSRCSETLLEIGTPLDSNTRRPCSKNGKENLAAQGGALGRGVVWTDVAVVTDLAKCGVSPVAEDPDATILAAPVHATYSSLHSLIRADQSQDYYLRIDIR